MSQQPVVIQNRPQIVEFTIQNTPQRFVNFTFTAIDGQTEFDLGVQPIAVIILGINGAVQNAAAGDFTLSGTVITLSQGVDADDVVYGIYQL